MARTRFTARFRWLSALPQLVVTVLLGVLAVSTLSGAESRNGGARERLFDLFQRVSPADAAATTPIHIVEIDRASLDAVGPWPWPRSIAAELVEKSFAAGARSVVYLEPVDSPDPLSPETIGAFWLAGARDNALAAELALLPSTDATLAAAFGAGDAAATALRGAVTIAPGPNWSHAENLALSKADVDAAAWIDVDTSGGFVGLPRARARFAINDALTDTPALIVSVGALPIDHDGVLRAPPLLWTLGEAPAPSTALAAARLALPDARVELDADPTKVSSAGQEPAGLRLGGAALPMDSAARMRLYLPQRLDVPSTSATRILNNRGSNSQLAGKVVLIGLDAETGGSVRLARGAVSPAQAHALIAQQLISGAAAHRPGWTGYLEALMVMALGAAAIMWSQKLDFWRSFTLSAVAAAAAFAATGAAFEYGRLLIDPLPASLAAFLGAFSVAGGRSIGAVLKDDSVRGSFRGALPEPTMKRLREDGDAHVLDAARRTVTVLACELRILDDDLQKLENHPGVAAELIAGACASIRKTLVEVGGAVDQANGGKIFAYFNAPLETADHARAACAGALRLVESMDTVNAKLEAATQTRGVQIHLAIGIAAGPCFVGPMGHGKTNRYSALGRAVEMAAFLRRQAEYYGPAIICDETVYQDTRHHFAFLELARLRARGDGRVFSIHALVGNPFVKSSKSFRQLDDVHRALLASYREGQFLEARAHLMKARQHPGANIALFDIYEARIRAAVEGDEEIEDDAEAVTI